MATRRANKPKEETVEEVVTREHLAELERQLSETKAQYERQREARRREVTLKLSDLADEIKAIVRQAQALAATVDLEFQWHDGYEEFITYTEEEWNSSSRYC